jgi:prolyl 4-hydroxylase
VILNSQPLIAQFDSQLDQSTIDWLLNLNDYNLSQGYHHQTESSDLTTARTSTTLFDDSDQCKEIRNKILSRVLAETGHSYTLSQSELLQLTRYRREQQYVAHYDHFNLPGYENSVEVDRVATVILYLNDGFQGGETYFPKLNITVTPRQGDLLYFHYPAEIADMSLHAGLPVITGEKRIATLWIRKDCWPVQG